MPDLEASLSRDALPQPLRCLIAATIAIGQADWDGLDRAVAIGRRVGANRDTFDESTLQATLFYGFPRAVTAFERLSATWPTTSHPESPTRGQPHAELREAGLRLFEGIYADRTDSVRQMLAGFHPEFHDFVIESAYGRILARPGLDVMSRELCAVSALAVLDQIPQLVAHARGALRFGADRSAICETLWMTDREDEQLVARIVRGYTP